MHHDGIGVAPGTEDLHAKAATASRVVATSEEVFARYIHHPTCSSSTLKSWGEIQVLLWKVQRHCRSSHTANNIPFRTAAPIHHLKWPAELDPTNQCQMSHCS